MVVEELVKQGANIDIRFHDCESLHDAYKKLHPFKQLGSIKRYNREGTYWLKISNAKKNINIVAFYENKTKK